MLFIDNEVQRQILTIEDCINAQEIAFKELSTGEATHRPRIDVYSPSERTDAYWRWGSMEGVSQALGVFATRMKSDILTWPVGEDGNWTEEKHNTRPGLFCGLVFLFSTRNGEPLAILNDGIIQHMRVGAAAGLGAKYLARANSRVVGMLGSGGMARTSLQAFCAVRGIERVHVYSPTREHREGYAAEMREELGVDVVAVDSPKEAVGGADIVCFATDGMRAAVSGDWLEPGMHVTNPGRGMGLEVLERAEVIIRQGVGSAPPVDEELRRGRGYSTGTPEELARLPDEGALRSFSRTKYPTFPDLAAGTVEGRTSDDQITVYLDVGNQGLQFAACGSIVYEKAKERGLGHEVPTEWFLQDIRD